MRSLAAALTLGVAVSIIPFTPSGSLAHTVDVHVRHVQAKKHTPKGVVSSVSDDSVVVTMTNKQTGATHDRTFKTDDKTKVTLDGKESKLADLKKGQKVTITPGDDKNDPVMEIAATSVSDDSSK